MTDEEGRNRGAPTTIAVILGKPQFEQGYRSMWRGLPFDYEATTDTFEYERGRQFALLEKLAGLRERPYIKAPPRPLSPGGISPALCDALAECFIQRWICR